MRGAARERRVATQTNAQYTTIYYADEAESQDDTWYADMARIDADAAYLKALGPRISGLGLSSHVLADERSGNATLYAAGAYPLVQELVATARARGALAASASALRGRTLALLYEGQQVDNAARQLASALQRLGGERQAWRSGRRCVIVTGGAPDDETLLALERGGVAVYDGAQRLRPKPPAPPQPPPGWSNARLARGTQPMAAKDLVEVLELAGYEARAEGEHVLVRAGGDQLNLGGPGILLMLSGFNAAGASAGGTAVDDARAAAVAAALEARRQQVRAAAEAAPAWAQGRDAAAAWPSRAAEAHPRRTRKRRHINTRSPPPVARHDAAARAGVGAGADGGGHRLGGRHRRVGAVGDGACAAAARAGRRRGRGRAAAARGGRGREGAATTQAGRAAAAAAAEQAQASRGKAAGGAPAKSAEDKREQATQNRAAAAAGDSAQAQAAAAAGDAQRAGAGAEHAPAATAPAPAPEPAAQAVAAPAPAPAPAPEGSQDRRKRGKQRGSGAMRAENGGDSDVADPMAPRQSASPTAPRQLLLQRWRGWRSRWWGRGGGGGRGDVRWPRRTSSSPLLLLLPHLPLQLTPSTCARAPAPARAPRAAAARALRGSRASGSRERPARARTRTRSVSARTTERKRTARARLARVRVLRRGGAANARLRQLARMRGGQAAHRAAAHSR